MNFLKLGILSILSLIFSIAIFTRDFWPSVLSRADSIDPLNMSENYDPTAKIAYFNNRAVAIPSFKSSPILGEESPDSNKRIEINLTEQKVYAYENDQLVYSFLISSGKWGRTHPGTYQIWSKIRSQKMSGGSREFGTYYYLPNVPYIMFFYNREHPKSMGYSLHGTYWHNNFGIPMSHGCVNMKTTEAALMYQWAQIGTPITITGKYQYSQALK